MVDRIGRLIRSIAASTATIGIVSLFWLLIRSGTRPSRIVYPCQKAAAATSYNFLIYPFIAFVADASRRTASKAVGAVKNSRRKKSILYATLLSLSISASGLTLYSNVMVSPVSALSERSTLTQELTSVSVVKVSGGVQTALATALDHIGGIGSLIPVGAKVLIKPNIVRNQAPPDTVDPVLVTALINIIKQRNPSVIWVADGSGEGNTISNFKALGYSAVDLIPGVELVDLNYGSLVNVSVPGGGYVFNSFQFNQILVDADVFISVACMKTHDTAVVTLGMKNLVGIAAGSVYGIPKMVLHQKAQEKGDTYMGGVIVDLCSARKINLNIIDGRVAMEGQGPHEGPSVNMGILVVGKDPVATDSVASAIVGFDPEKVPTLKLGREKGLGTNDLHKIRVRGERLEDVYRTFLPATGHESFLLFSGIPALLYKWRSLLPYPTIGFWVVTGAVAGLAKRLRREPQAILPLPTSQESRVQEAPVKPRTAPGSSSKRVEDDIDDRAKDFQAHVREIKDIALRLEELAKLFRSGEIHEKAYGAIADELGGHLSLSFNELLKSREVLELYMAMARLEWAKEKVRVPVHTTQPNGLGGSQSIADLRYIRGYKDVVESGQYSKGLPSSMVYSSNLQKWEDQVSKIGAALSSLSIGEEASIIEQYLSLIRDGHVTRRESEDVRKALLVCQQRLGSVSERWAPTRREKIDQLIGLEAEASRLKDEIKEIAARFGVGELSQDGFEYRMNVLQTALKKVENEVSDVRALIDDMDMRIFRCTELLRE